MAEETEVSMAKVQQKHPRLEKGIVTVIGVVLALALSVQVCVRIISL